MNFLANVAQITDHMTVTQAKGFGCTNRAPLVPALQGFRRSDVNRASAEQRMPRAVLLSRSPFEHRQIELAHAFRRASRLERIGDQRDICVRIGGFAPDVLLKRIGLSFWLRLVAVQRTQP